jgi:hypothetical protein
VGYLALVALHFTTKEIPHWVWGTVWWHDRPDSGRFGFDRPGLVVGAFRNYLMTASYSMNEPRELDGGAHIAFNPWLEGPFPGGVQSNCMSCHRRAAWTAVEAQRRNTARGEVSVADRETFPTEIKKGGEVVGPRVKTDFIWTIADFEREKGGCPGPLKAPNPLPE